MKRLMKRLKRKVSDSIDKTLTWCLGKLLSKADAETIVAAAYYKCTLSNYNVTALIILIAYGVMKAEKRVIRFFSRKQWKGLQ